VAEAPASSPKFDRIRKGMSVEEVEDILGTSENGGDASRRFAVVNYHCSGSTITIVYRDARVVSKALAAA
jgi:hypothetical protein